VYFAYRRATDALILSPRPEGRIFRIRPQGLGLRRVPMEFPFTVWPWSSGEINLRQLQVHDTCCRKPATFVRKRWSSQIALETQFVVSTYSGLYGPMSVGVASRPRIRQT